MAARSVCSRSRMSNLDGLKGVLVGVDMQITRWHSGENKNQEYHWSLHPIGRLQEAL